MDTSSLLATSPLLSPNEAHLVAFSLTSAYVGGLYLSRLSLARQSVRPRATGSQSTKSKDETPLNDLVEADVPLDMDRDDPRVIRSRVKAVGVATLGGCALVGGIIYYRGNAQDLRATLSVTMRHLGLPNSLPPLPNYPLPSLSSLSRILPSPSSMLEFFISLPSKIQLAILRPPLLPYLLAPVLFTGPILTSALEKTWPGQTYGRRLFSLKDGGVWDCLALALPGFVRNGWNALRGERAEEEVSPAVERRRWVEMRNYIVGPITEEIVFRSCIISTYLLAAYDEKTRWKSLVLGTPCWFGLAHMHHAWEVYKKGGRTGSAAGRALASAGFQFTYTTLFGWFAAYLFVKTDSVLPAIASHVFCNIMGFPDPMQAIDSFPSMKGPIIGSYLAGIGGFVYGLRQL